MWTLAGWIAYDVWLIGYLLGVGWGCEDVPGTNLESCGVHLY